MGFLRAHRVGDIGMSCVIRIGIAGAVQWSGESVEIVDSALGA